MRIYGYLILVVLTLTLITMGACGQPPVTPPVTTPPVTTPVTPSVTTPAKVPNIIAGTQIPRDRISFNQPFGFEIIVFNTGNGPAQNAHLYCRANPGGLITVKGVDQPSTPLAPSGLNVDLGDLYPGSQRTVIFILQSPTKAAVDGLNVQNFEISFAAGYDGGTQAPVGTITFSVDQGMIVLTKAGFAQ
jgi:hypothetical protein